MIAARSLWFILCVGLIAIPLGCGTSPSSTASRGEPSASGTAELKQNMTVDLGSGISMEFVLIRPGSFLMGSEKGDPDQKPVHKVNITQAFYLGKYDVTQEQWQAVMGGNPSKFKGLRNPVGNVSWDDCQEFLKKLDERVSGQMFKLPTEAQWEYACRAGTTTEYYFGDDQAGLDDYAWTTNNAGGTTHPVGQKKPNAWGLYDMHGNIWQWCSDWYGNYPEGEASDPRGPDKGQARVLRGAVVERPSTGLPFRQPRRQPLRPVRQRRVPGGAGL